MKEKLNTTYYNSLSDTSKAMIDENGIWNVGPAGREATAQQSYETSLVSKTISDATHITPWIGKVGLMASYEYLYATGVDTCLTVGGRDYDSGCGKETLDWLYSRAALWTLSPRIDGSDFALCAYYGAINYYGIGDLRNAVPAVFLKSDVKIVSGDGKAISTAYVLK